MAQKITKSDLLALLTIAGQAKSPIQFLAGANREVGSVRYYIKDVPHNGRSFIYFLKAVPNVADFWRWPMSFDRDRQLRHESQRSMCDVSTYTPAPQRNKIFKHLMLNLQKDFELRSVPFPLQQMELMAPQSPSMFRPIVANNPMIPNSGVSGPFNGIPAPIGTNISFDDFLNTDVIDNMQYMPSNHPRGRNIYPEKAIGWMVFSDPAITQPINEAKVFYYNPFGFVGNTKEPVYKQDLASVVCLFNGINPKTNPRLRKLIGMEMARVMQRDGCIPIQNHQGLAMVLPPGESVGNLFGKWSKKLTKWVKHTGKKIEKGLTTPMRNWMKEKAPGVWKIIDSVDKKLGVEKILKKYGVTLEVMAKKYGAKLMEAAVNAAVSTAASYVGVDPKLAQKYTMVAIKTADQLSSGKKADLLKIASTAFSAADINKGDVGEIVSSMLTSVKDQMVGEKGVEGKQDFNSFLNIVQDMYTEGKKEMTKVLKEEKVAEKIEPLLQSGNVTKMALDALSAIAAN